MIKYKSLNGIPIDEQGNIVECKYTLIQSDFVLVFETHDELMEYIKPDFPISKRAEIESQAEFLFDSALEKYWYSRFDVLLYAKNGEPNALKVVQYYELLWATIETNFNIENYDFTLPAIS